MESSTLRWAAHAFDTLIAPNLSALRECGAQPVSELPSYSGALRLNHVLAGVQYHEGVLALLLGFIGRLRTAVSEYNLGFEKLQSDVGELLAEQRLSDHRKALAHFETAVLQLHVSIVCLHGAGKIMGLPRLYSNRDGSEYDRLREISNRVKHFDEDVIKAMNEGEHVPIAPVWLTDVGLEASTAHLSFAEIEQIMREQSIDAKFFSLDLPRRILEERKVQEEFGSHLQLLCSARLPPSPRDGIGAPSTASPAPAATRTPRR